MAELIKKPVDQLTPAEKGKILAFIDQAYKQGDFTLMEADVLRAKYSGKQSATSMLGVEVMSAASKKDSVDRALEKNKKDADKKIIRNAAIGGAVGGLGGQIVGAATAMNDIAQEREQLLKDQKIAEQKLDEIMKKNAKL